MTEKIVIFVRNLNEKSKKFNESNLLKLNSGKAYKILKWRGVLTFNETIKMTTLWYKNFYSQKRKKLSINQVKEYIKIFNKRSKIKI